MIPLKLKSNLELNHMHITHVLGGGFLLFFFVFFSMDVAFSLKLMLENVVGEKQAFLGTKTRIRKGVF